MSESSGGFQKRSVGKCILFSIITLGFYPLYWIHQYNVELQQELGADYNPVMRTVGLLIPFYNFLVMWKMSQDTERMFSGKSAVVWFVLMMFIGPIWWFLLQSEINSHA